MGTKIKNHFRAENWIKIKPKMWFNQVRIILFYIIQIKIKLNVKPKMPHVSDQYRGGHIWVQKYFKICYHMVSKLVASTTQMASESDTRDSEFARARLRFCDKKKLVTDRKYLLMSGTNTEYL